MPNQITEVYLLEGCGITESQALYAKNQFNPAGYVNNSNSFGDSVHVITSINDFPNLGILIRREIGNEQIDPPFLMVTRNPLPGQYVIIIEEANLYPTTANLPHEYGHVVGFGHTHNSKAVMYGTSNSTTSLYQDDIYGIYAQYCKPSFTVPTEPIRLLRGDNKFSIALNSYGKSLPINYLIDAWDNNSVGDERQILLSNKEVSGSNTISHISNTWDSSQLANGIHLLKLYADRSEDCTGNYTHNQYGHDVAMDELEVMLYDLTFDSPKENQRYSVSTPLNFKVYGKSAIANVDISEIGNIATVTYKLEEDDLFGSNVFVTETDSTSNFELTENLVNYNIDAVNYLVTVTVKDELGNVLAIIEKMPIQLFVPVDIKTPTPQDIYYPKTEKGVVTDTLSIKVSVPELAGSFPEIDIKIEDAYVPHGDIYFDSADSLWTYDWVISGLSAGITGKRYYITSEITGNPNSKDVSSVYLVEAIFHEDFEVITNLTAAGWNLYTYNAPDSVTQDGWLIGNKVLENNNGCAISVTKPNQTNIGYRLWSPVISLPSVTDSKIKLSHRVFYDAPNPPDPHSVLKFCITNASQSMLTGWTILSSVDDSWIDNEYDLTQFAGQDIKLQWFNNYYNSPTPPPLPIMEYSIDDIVVYIIPDMEGPNIDFITGNTAEPNEDMNLVLEFNDTSGIDEVTADYSIEGDSGTITLNPVKGSYNYTGMISARDHECNGSISYRIVDSVGNETISGGRTINWALGGFVLTAPGNVVITQPTSTTISITWDIVDGATSYKVYSSLDPYGTFSLDTTGTFTESRKWEKTLDGNKYFYYVIATNPTKFDSEAIKEEEFEIAKAKENISDR
ncbi:MAG: matrixin family metalloprotease [Candidatus Delongbacteria bacterium]|nr:matrixin family metalloprotease [Candidatus Delongbacteria bacterium]